MGETKNAYEMIFEKPEGKRPLGKSWSRLEDNNKVEIK
jgi:hypothetical protein